MSTEDEAHLQPDAEGPQDERITAITSAKQAQPGSDETAAGRPDEPAPATWVGVSWFKDLAIFAGNLKTLVVQPVQNLIPSRYRRMSLAASVDDNTIDISSATHAQRERLTNAWLSRHADPKERSNQPEPDKSVQEELEKIYSDSLQRALSVEEVRDGLQQAGLDPAFLQNHMQRSAPEIWGSVAQELEPFVDYASNTDNRITVPKGREHQNLSRLRWRRTARVNLKIDGDELVLVHATREQCDQLLQMWIERCMSGRPDLEHALVERGMLPFIRTFLNDYIKPSYDAQLSIRDAPGLSEVFDPIYHIPTQPTLRLQRLMGQIPGGSIGVSGPRGVGKTTLIRSCTANRATDGYVLSVMVSAPVDYAARDFILHLFETVCRNIANEDASVPGTKIAVPSPPSGNPLAGYKLSPAALGLGMAIIGGVVVLGQQFQIPMKIVLTVSGTLLAILGLTVTLSTLVRYRSAARAKSVGKALPIASPHLDVLAPLRTFASERLQEIKFQQSFSTGWSGALSIPVGVQASITGTTTLAQMQMSLPDVVEALRDFLGRAARIGRVIIGIDELDKIGSDEKARQFLNDIKGIFGLEHCYYLVSVSEEAMAGFERRGLPFRDVFDSSFDEIIKVSYLEFDDAKRMLARRVLGLPVPFTGLCYCISGGLPRDLIRAARRLIDIPRPPAGELRLGQAAATLLQDELASKTEAVVAAIMRIGLEPVASQVVTWADALDLTDLQSQKLLDHCRKFTDAVQFDAVTAQGDEAFRISQVALLRLSRELRGLYYYCSTMLEFFSDDTEPARLQRAEDHQAGVGSLNYLARSRNTFAINASVAWAAVSKFRVAWNMEQLEFY